MANYFYSFFLIFFSHICLSQSSYNANFIYVISINENIDVNPINEKFELSISENKSVYYNVINNKLDSLRKKFIEKNDMYGYTNEKSKFPKQKILYSIFKENEKYTYQLRVGLNILQYSEKIPDFKWEILQEKETILDLICQKAETTYEGNKYTAWFTSEIPISNGPFIFQGLPGLIVKIIDNDNNIISLREINTKNKELPKIENEKIVKTDKEKILQAIEGSYNEFLVTYKITDKSIEKEAKKKIEEKLKQLYLYRF